MSDPFENFSSGLSSPATDLHEITPNDGQDLTVFPRALAVNTSGRVRITTIAGTTTTIYAVAGAPWPVRVSRVWETGTDAAGIVGLI